MAAKRKLSIRTVIFICIYMHLKLSNNAKLFKKSRNNKTAILPTRIKNELILCFFSFSQCTKISKSWLASCIFAVSSMFFCSAIDIIYQLSSMCNHFTNVICMLTSKQNIFFKFPYIILLKMLNVLIITFSYSSCIFNILCQNSEPYYGTNSHRPEICEK